MNEFDDVAQPHQAAVVRALSGAHVLTTDVEGRIEANLPFAEIVPRDRHYAHADTSLFRKVSSVAFAASSPSTSSASTIRIG